MNPIVSNSSDLQQTLCKIVKLRDKTIAANEHKLRIDNAGAIDKIIDLSKAVKSERIIIGIGGCPGSGKTTIARDIVAKLNTEFDAQMAAYLPMDGFHYANTVLDSRGLQDIKGDITTYDVEGYLAKLAEFKHSADRTIMAPDYIREKHDVFENMIEIQSGGEILITEGIYLGYGQEKWIDVRNMLDLLFYLDTPPEQCADRIAARNLQVGRSAKVIESKLKNDFWFMERSIQGFESADYILASA